MNFSYSTNGLTKLNLYQAIEEIKAAGYGGVELSFQYGQFDPFSLTDDDLIQIKEFCQIQKIKPVAISTATTCFLSNIPHEPSLLSIDPEKRQMRIDLIKRGIDIAKKMGIPIVSFQSGYLREEHTSNSHINPKQFLEEAIKECLEETKGEVTLVIEPEPGMYIESNEDAINLINTINSPYFRLHLDIGHAYCTEKDYVNSIAQALPYIAYMHLADIKDGYNLRFYVLEDLSSELKDINIDFTYAGYLFYFKRTDTFLFVDKHWSYYFCTEMFSPMEKTDVETFKQQMKKSFFVDYIPINHTNVNHFPEVNLVDVSAYVDAIPEISISLQNKIRPILNFLRSFKIANTAIIPQPVCNTVKGKVHYHEMPGEGGIDFTAVLEVLKDSYYEGFITVELYNHVEVWEKALSPTLCYLNQCINSKLEVSNA